MAAIHDLLAQVQDEALRARLEQEINRLSKTKKFGLVFEEHLPECTPLYDIPVKKGSLAAKKTGSVSDMYEVCAIKEGMATCCHKVTKEKEEIPAEDLVCVAQFGEPIYPYLKLVDSVRNGGDSDPWHTLIEADNYHALQLLEYLYAGKVDCIYIDPPYNTGARDWKYNNDYVDSNDAYRHSKWLSMMKKRLKLAGKLMNPDDSVLLVTIDEKEYLHLGCLLEELFPDARIQMISTMINPANVARAGEFGRSGEYIFCVMMGSAAPLRVKLDREWVSNKGRTHTGNIRWDLLKRSGTNAERRHSPGGFYPIYIDPSNGKIHHLGEPLPPGISKAPKIDGLFTLLPIRQNGTEGNWQWAANTFMERMKQGRVKIGGNADRGFTVYILKDGEYSKILKGEFNIIGRGINQEILVEDKDTDHVMATPGDIWKIASHDATQYGSRLIGNIFQDRRFTFPKSLYAVKDCIYFFTADKPDALILDFFAGSGTTLHAVNLLNAEDGGHRKCIMITNNEVSEREAKSLKNAGYHPGDEEWERLGIARYVTWPRTVCSIEGHDVNGKPLRGNYLGTEMPMAEGLRANAVFFKLGFLDKISVALGRQLTELFPVLWMKAGSCGLCPQLKEGTAAMEVLPENRFAILMDEKYFQDFNKEVNKFPEIQTIYIVTDSEAGFREMASEFCGKATFQLYRDYLDNFRINTGRQS